MSLLDEIRASQGGAKKVGEGSGNGLLDAIRADVPWYAPVPQAPSAKPVDNRPVDSAAIADVIGAGATKPSLRAPRIADTIENPNLPSSIVRRSRSEARRASGERGLVAGPGPEDSWSEIGRKFVSRIGPLLKQSVGGLTQAIIESANVPPPNAPLTSSEYADMQRDLDAGLAVAREKGIIPGQQLYKSATDDLAANGYNLGDSTTKRYATMIAESMAQMVPSIAASIATRNPYLGAAMTGGQVGGAQYGESREAGRAPEQAMRDAVFMGGAEALGEQIPLGMLMKPGGKFIAHALKTAGAEGLQEVFTQTLQTGYDMGILHPDMTWGEARQQIIDAGIVGAAMGGGMATIAAPFRPAERPTPIDPTIDAATRTAFDPNRPGIHNIDGAPVNITAADVSSPIPTDLIARGKAAVTRASDPKLQQPAAPSPAPMAAPPTPPAASSPTMAAVSSAMQAGVSPLEEADLIDAQLARTPAASPVPQTPPLAAQPQRAAAARGAPVGNAKAITQELFPEATVTSWAREKDDPLTRANPKSWHAKSKAAVDVRPIKGMSFEQFVQRYRDAGYTILEALNETGAGRSKHATGDHWHIVLGEGGATPQTEQAEASPAPSSMIDEIRASQAPEVQGRDVRGEAIDDEWVRFAPETQTLDVPRAEMPQVAAEHRGALVNFLNARGIAHEEMTVAADSLKPTQSEFSVAKVAKAKRYPGSDRAILVSSDGYVVDGHHQWVAARDQGQDVRIIRLDAPIRDLLKTVPEMPSATTDGGATRQVVDMSTEQPAIAPVEATEPPAPTAPPPADAPAVSPQISIEPMPSGQSILVRGVDAGSAEFEALQSAARGARPIWNEEKSGWVVAKKHEAAAKAALIGGDRRAVGYRDRRNDLEADALTFIAANGGIRDDEGHDLRKGRAIQRFIPGQGALVRPSGQAIDRVRERLVETGWLPSGSTVADTLDFIERANRSPVYHPTSDRNVQALTDGKESEAEGRTRVSAVATEMGVDLADADLSYAMELVADGETERMAIFRAMDAAMSRDAEAYASAPSTDENSYDIPGFDDAETAPDAARAGDGREAATPPSRDGQGGGRPAPDAGAARDSAEASAQPRRDPEPDPSVAPANADPVYDEDGAQIGWLDSATGELSGMEQAQRSELNARAQQSMIRRGGQEAISDQEGGLFDAARDQATLFSRIDPIATITGDELGVDFKGDEDFRDLITAAKAWYRKNLVGRTITMADGVPVSFSSRGLRESTTHKGDVLLRLIPAIPDILTKGTVASRLPGNRPDIRGVVWVKAPVNFMGQEITVAVAVREHSDGKHRQYTLTNVDWLHDVAGGRLSRTDGTASKTLGGPDRNAPPAGLNIQIVESEANSVDTGIRDELRARLSVLGMTDRVALEAADGFNDARVAGFYQAGIIRVALNSSQAPIDTLNHEAIHALRDLGLFRAPEWRSLESAARADAPLMGSVRKRYPDLTEAQQVEEAIADRFMRWSKGRRERGFIAQAFDRARDFIRALGQALRGKGFTTADSVMRAIERGDVGARAESSVEIDAPPRESIIGAIQSITSGPRSAAFGDAMDRWRTALQDRYLPLLRTQQAVEQQLGRPLTEDENPYLAEELMSGRIGARMERLADDTVEPLLAAIHEEGVTVAELEEYLYARHAPERNARIAKINPSFQQGEGSGMTDVEAAQVMTDVDAAGKRPAMERLAARVDAMLSEALQTRVDGGLMSQADADLWRNQYQHYVPLRGQLSKGRSAGLSGRISQQSGISVKGKESRRAFGRASRADSILAYAVMQAEEAIVRAEKNRVAQRFLDLANTGPDPDFWKVDKIERRAVFNKTTGLVEYQNQSRISADDAPYTVSVKVDGVEHRVTMNRDNPAAVRLAASMRNLNEQQVEFVVKYLGAVNRFLSTVNTSYNPEFIITNAFRDLQTAGINLAAERGGIVAGTMKDYRSALAASVKGSFGKGAGPWTQWYRDFVMDGGRTYFNQVEDLDAIKNRLQKAMALASDRAAGKLSVKRGFFAARELIENLNLGVENAIRLSAYKNAREAGMSRSRAASLAKNLTVNFNRRGTFGPLVNSLYLFFNASMQGTARIVTAMKSPRVRKVMMGVMVMGAALELLNAMLSGDDDDGESYYDKISAFDKARNLIIMIPGTKGEHIKIPLPYGYNVFQNAGRTVAEVARRGGARWQESAAGFVGSVADAFNPIGGTQSLLNFIAPTIADPIVDLERNRDFADKPIMPDENQFGPKTPDAQRYFSSVGAHWKAITDGLTALSGGNDVVAGAIDVSPETLEYMSGVVMGAAGAFVDRSAGLFTKTFDGEATINDVPFLRKLVGGEPSWYDKGAYYDRVSQVEQAVAEAKELRERGMTEAFDRYVADHEAVLQMQSATKAAKKQMRKIRAARNQSQFDLETGAIDDTVAADDKQRIKQAETTLIEAYNARWNEIVLANRPKPDVE